MTIKGAHLSDETKSKIRDSVRRHFELFPESRNKFSKTGKAWTTKPYGGHKTLCLSCKGEVQSTPRSNCTEPRHAIVAQKQKAYRKQRYIDVNYSYQKKYQWRTKKKVIDMLGGKCMVCGATDLRILTLNHKNGDGHSDSNHIYRDIVSGRRKTDDLDVRCMNDNILYEYEMGRLVYQ